MPIYIYTAKNKQGENKVGNLEAADQQELVTKLRREDLTLISAKTLEEENGEESAFSFKRLVRILNRVTLTEKMMFTRHLAVMIKAGLSINQALGALAQQSKNPKFERIIYQIEKDVRQGQPLSQAMAKHPQVFDELYVSMIRVGETGGSLDSVLKNLAEQMRKDHDLVSRVRGAMIYPAVILIALFGIGALMMIVVVPKLTQIFIELGTELPLSTQIIIGISNFIQHHYPLGLLLIVCFFLLIKILIRNKKIKKIIHIAYLKAPIFGELTKKVNSARFARTFSSLIVSGVDIVNALKIIANTLRNINFQESLRKSASQVQKGQELSSVLAEYKNLYPPMVIQMIQVGEQTGDVAGILSNLADFYEEEIDRTTKNMSSIIEPIIMVIIGSAVGFFAISMLQPMYSMMQGI